jgi:hypothetical protein
MSVVSDPSVPSQAQDSGQWHASVLPKRDTSVPSQAQDSGQRRVVAACLCAASQCHH